MKITAITELYPADFKGYFDAQFADLVRRGQELSILAAGSAQRAPNETVRTWELDRRTRYYPATSRTLYRGLAPGVALRVPGTWLRIRQLKDQPGRLRLRLAVRLAALARTDPDAVIIHGLSAGRSFTGLRRVLPDVPVACYYHGGELPGTPPVPDDVAARIFGEANVVFSNTRFSADHAVARGCPPDRVQVLPVGIDLERYPEPEPRPVTTRSPRFLSASRMSEEKGLIHALEALALLDERGVRDWRYTLTGDGPMRPLLERFAMERRLDDRIEFLGTVSASQMVEEMGRADFLLLPSLHLGNWVENQAVVVQEGMLMNTIPITTHTGGLPESVPEEVRRLQVPPADPVVLADRLESVLQLDEPALDALRSAGRDFVTAGYDIRRLNQRMLQILAEESAGT